GHFQCLKKLLRENVTALFFHKIHRKKKNQNSGGRKMGQKGYQSPAKKVLSWIRKKSKKVKIFLGLITAISLLVTLKLVVHDHNLFFVIAEAIHLIGLLVLIYKLTTLKTCSGLSLKTQVLTAIFLAVRLYCSFIMEADIHTVLDFITLVATVWVIYMMKFKLKASYMAELDVDTYF
ncbi:hypothetical protein AABB24_011945, partial [Solanum stoloniferum]